MWCLEWSDGVCHSQVFLFHANKRIQEAFLRISVVCEDAWVLKPVPTLRVIQGCEIKAVRRILSHFEDVFQGLKFSREIKYFLNYWQFLKYYSAKIQIEKSKGVRLFKMHTYEKMSDFPRENDFFQVLKKFWILSNTKFLGK